MKRNSIFTIIVVGVIAVAGVIAARGLKTYLYGEDWPANALLVSGNAENVEAARTAYNGSVEYTKDYDYKYISFTRELLDQNDNQQKDENGEIVTYTRNYMIVSKSTARQLLADQILRLKKGDPTEGSLETEVMESIPYIDESSVVYLGGMGLEDSEDMPELAALLGTGELQYGAYAWIGFYPEGGQLLITDDSIYEQISIAPQRLTLIAVAKSFDCKSEKAREGVKGNLSDISGIKINYAHVK